MFNKRKTLSAAIHLACSGVVASGLILSGMASAEEEAVKLEKEEVTGSHIKQIDIEGASPVAVISREDIELSGLQSVADVLRQTPYNSFGSFRETSGNTFQSQSLVDLRGLGSSRTLVLINGRRAPASPVTGGTGVDLNILPLAAVERIEILKDSASAVYGSEAIGGVVNIILRKDYEGVEVSATVERPSLPGADAQGGSFAAGGSYGKGHYIFTLEQRNKDIIYSRDRDWSKVDYGDGQDYLTTEGISIFGNTVYHAFTDGTFEVKGPCDPPVYSGVYDYFGEKVCTYPYANVSAETNDIKRSNAFLYLDYEVNNDTTIYAQNLISRVESFGRYAPAVGFMFVDADAPGNPYPGEPIFMLHRFAAFGPRDDTATNWQWDTTLGVKGTVWDVDYDVYARYNLYDSDIVGRNYILDSQASQEVLEGNYNFLDPFSTDPEHLAAMERMRHDTTRDVQNKYFSAGINLTGETPFELAGGNIGWAAGYEYRDEDYQDIYDAERRAHNVIGSSGGSSAGDRQQYAIYGEALIPVLDTVELSAALRYDHYSDFGSETSPQLKVRWQPMDNLLLRASWSQGFRAPAMIDLYAAGAEDHPFVKDWTQCALKGIPADQCPTQQVNALSGGNPDLEAENSDSWNLGAVWEPVEDLVLEANYYNIKLENVVSTISPQTLLNFERDGIGLPSGTSIERDANGNITLLKYVTANVAEREVSGVDISARYTWDIGEWGVLKPEVTWAHINEYLFQGSPDVDKVDIIGDWAQPQDRVQGAVRWDVKDFTVGWIVNWIAGMDADPNNIDSYAQHDFTFTYHAGWDGDITLGIQNAFEEDPPIDTSVDDASNFYPLYPIDGRVWSLTYKQRF
ncbi:TonB-dependent receptor [Thiolapillus sp.]